MMATSKEGDQEPVQAITRREETLDPNKFVRMYDEEFQSILFNGCLEYGKLERSIADYHTENFASETAKGPDRVSQNDVSPAGYRFANSDGSILGFAIDTNSTKEETNPDPIHFYGVAEYTGEECKPLEDAERLRQLLEEEYDGQIEILGDHGNVDYDTLEISPPSGLEER